MKSLRFILLGLVLLTHTFAQAQESSYLRDLEEQGYYGEVIWEWDYRQQVA